MDENLRCRDKAKILEIIAHINSHEFYVMKCMDKMCITSTLMSAVIEQFNKYKSAFIIRPDKVEEYEELRREFSETLDCYENLLMEIIRFKKHIRFIYRANGRTREEIKRLLGYLKEEVELIKYDIKLRSELWGNITHMSCFDCVY